MTMHQVYVTFKENSSLVISIILIIMTFIQITPIKVNPWSALIRWLSKSFTSDIGKQLSELEKKVDSVNDKLNTHIEESNAIDLRKRRESILDFASAIAEGKRSYTKEQYEQMLSECDSYGVYCESKNFKNSVADESISLIRHSYMSKMLNNSFLKTNFGSTPEEK